MIKYDYKINLEDRCHYEVKKIDPKSIAILILTYSDYLSFQVALPKILKHTSNEIDIYILQNGSDAICKKCIDTSKFYMEISNNLKIIYSEKFNGEKPWDIILNTIKREEFKKYDYFIKIDDDSFPLTDDWVDRLVSSLDVDNTVSVPLCSTSTEQSVFNALKINNLLDDFFENCWVPHYSGRDCNITGTSDFVKILNSGSKKFEYERKWISNKEWDFTWEGTTCGPSFFIRYFHENISLKPEVFKKNVKKYENCFLKVNTSNFLTINCICFKRDFLLKVEEFINGRLKYDEININSYLINNTNYWLLVLDVPLVHIHRYKHRKFNSDLNEKFFNVYQKDFPWKIKLFDDRVIFDEIENSLTRFSYNLKNYSFVGMLLKLRTKLRIKNK